MWRRPVTLGGGSTMQKGSRSVGASARKYPRSTQIGYQRRSAARGSYWGGISSRIRARSAMPPSLRDARVDPWVR